MLARGANTGILRGLVPDDLFLLGERFEEVRPKGFLTASSAEDLDGCGLSRHIFAEHFPWSASVAGDYFCHPILFPTTLTEAY